MEGKVKNVKRKKYPIVKFFIFRFRFINVIMHALVNFVLDFEREREYYRSQLIAEDVKYGKSRKEKFFKQGN